MKAFVKALIKAKEQKALAITFENNPEYFWMEVVSSNLKRVRHNHQGDSGPGMESSQTPILEVEFKSGQVYRYTGVPLSHYEAMLTAESVGVYFIEHIKPNYPFQCLTPKK